MNHTYDLKKTILTLFLIFLCLSNIRAQEVEYNNQISSFDISSVAQDSQGYLWIGTAHGLNRYNGSNYMTWFSAAGENDLNNDDIRDVCTDTDGRVWLATQCGISCYQDGKFTSNGQAVFNPVSRVLNFDDNTLLAIGKDGFLTFDKETMRAQSIYKSPGTAWLKKVIVSTAKEVWFSIEEEDGTHIRILNGKLESIADEFIGKGVTVDAICEDVDHNIWIATSAGMLRYESRSRNRLPVPSTLTEMCSQGRILFLLPFRGNSILLGIRGRGLYSYNVFNGNTTHIAAEQKLEGGKYVCFVDRDENVWLSDGQSKLKFYSSNRPYAHLNPLDGEQFSQISHIFFDRMGRMWVNADGRLVCVNAETGDSYYMTPEKYSIRAAYYDSAGRIWAIANATHIIRINLEQNGLPQIERDFKADTDLFSIAEDSNGKMWLAGVRYFVTVDENDHLAVEGEDAKLALTFTISEGFKDRAFFFTVNSGVYEIQPNGTFRKLDEKLRNINNIIGDADGSIWLGTYNGGIMHYSERTGQISTISSDDGVVDPNIKSMLQDRNGNIWFSSAEHITKYDPRRRTLSVIHDDRFSDGMTYDLMSAAVGPDGRLYFGGSAGITIIEPDVEIHPSGKIRMNLESVAVDGKHRPLSPEGLKLKHFENNVSLRYAGLDYYSGSKLNYSYMLEGYDRGWNYGSNMNPVYSQLPPGKYTFRARVRTPNGTWSENEISYPIEIRPSPWATTFARIVYWLLTLSLIGGAFLILLRISTQRSKLELAAEREELNRRQMDFIANVSHELRTPLSLIYGPAKQLSEMVDGKAAFYAKTIMQNAERMKLLSEQFFATQSKTADDETLEVKTNDLCALIRSITDSYRYSALEKGIELELNAPESLICPFDRDKVSKIYSNLLSNAIKYGNGDGHIEVALVNDEANVSLSVSDDGIGIPEEKRGELFGRRKRLGAGERTPEVDGKGIGLNYSHHLAQLHGGSLTFAPNEPHGSVFTFTFPVPAESVSVVQASDTQPTEQSSVNNNSARGLVLVVDDNTGIRSFIRSIFEDEYSVIEACDGVEALELLRTSIPDVVISDIIMPNKSGDALCNDIKSDPDLAHIPVVLLSAKNDIKTIVDGMHKGSDAYISKPFEPELLKATVESLIRNRKIVQGRILNMTSADLSAPAEEESGSLKESEFSAAEREFMQKIHAILDEKIEYEKFSVQDLAQEMNISYSSLYAKVKALTGTTPQAFVSTYRMNIAMQLLQSGKYNVSEVAWKVGSSSPYTFSREFKRQFGFPPSKVLEK